MKPAPSRMGHAEVLRDKVRVLRNIPQRPANELFRFVQLSAQHMDPAEPTRVGHPRSAVAVFLPRLQVQRIPEETPDLPIPDVGHQIFDRARDDGVIWLDETEERRRQHRDRGQCNATPHVNPFHKNSEIRIDELIENRAPDSAGGFLVVGAPFGIIEEPGHIRRIRQPPPGHHVDIGLVSAADRHKLVDRPLGVYQPVRGVGQRDQPVGEACERPRVFFPQTPIPASVGVFPEDMQDRPELVILVRRSDPLVADLEIDIILLPSSDFLVVAHQVECEQYVATVPRLADIVVATEPAQWRPVPEEAGVEDETAALFDRRQTFP